MFDVVILYLFKFNPVCGSVGKEGGRRVEEVESELTSSG